MAQRRGRRSHDDYVEAVVPLIRADVWKLKDQKAFAEYPGVKALALLLACEAWPLGIALHLLMAGAVADVYAVACGSQTRQAQRTAEFLHRWYDEQQTVSAIAAGMHLSRSHVAKSIQHPALLLVAQRFLALAQSVDPELHSGGLQHAVSTYRRRQSGADLREQAGCACPECSTRYSNGS